LELLKYHQRVLYIDIDIHHGDGVEEAFYTTDRVLTVSFHKFGEYFPGTGDIRDIGSGKGKYHAVNFPLKDGINDETYQSIFQPIVKTIIEIYNPGAIVLQCGADSLSGDRLGCFNLSSRGHGQCVQFVSSFGIPLLVVGGGGYTIRNVSRCWTYETSVLLQTEISDELPFNDYIEYYGPEFKLYVPPTNMDNLNTKEYLEKYKNKILENIRKIGRPSVTTHDIPPDIYPNSEEDEPNPDNRKNISYLDKKVARNDELSDSEDEDDRRNIDIEESSQIQSNTLESINTNETKNQLTENEFIQNKLNLQENEEKD